MMRTKSDKPPRKTRGWLTTDEEEVAVRKERAAIESFRLVPVKDGFEGPFCNYSVAGASEPYQVEFRSAAEDINTCTCPDFRKNGLGTCKHIEKLRRRFPRLRGRSPRIEIFMDRETSLPRMACPDSADAKGRAFCLKFFDETGELRQPADAALSLLAQEFARLPAANAAQIRISVAVHAFAMRSAQNAALAGKRPGYAAQLRENNGRLPFLNHALYDYQVEGMLHLAFKGRAILADDMGLGKTVQAIAAAAVLHEAAGVRRVLVVAPTSLKTEWEEQIRKFTGLKYEILLGSRQQRTEIYRNTSAFFLIANYEQVVRDHDLISASFAPGLMILDEAQRIKNWQTKTARTLKRINSRFVFVLTGTPIENRIDDIYSLSELIDPTLFGSLFRFNRRFYDFNEFGKASGMRNLDELHRALSGIMLRRRKDEIAEELPERTDKNYFVEMTTEQSLRYADDEAIVVRLCAQAARRPLTPEEFKRLQLHLARMRMLCDTCHILDPKIKESPKVDELVRILDDIFEESPDRKILIFSEWVRMLDLVVERLEKKRIDYVLHTGSIPQAQRRIHINRFKTDPKCRIFLSSDSGGVGLNLQAASVVINLDLPWNPAKLEQRIARAWRKMQRNAVHVVNIIAAKSIEEKMLATLGFKQGLSDFVLDARGNQEDFEKANAKSAFISRLSDIIGKPLIQNRKPPADPVKHLADELGLSNLGLSELRMTTSGTGGDSAFLAVGNEMSEGFVRSKIKKSFGSDLPTGRLTILTPEIHDLLKKLEAQGFIQFVSEGTRIVYSAEPGQKPPSLLKASLLKLADKPLAEARRSLKMAKLLADGGFAQEAASPAAKAVLDAATARHALTLDALPDSAPDIAAVPHAIDRLSGSLAGPELLLLQLCLVGTPEGSAGLVAQASAFVDHVAAQLSSEALRP